MKKEIIIMDTTFFVDIPDNKLKEKGNTHNTISFDNMEYKGTHYILHYDKKTKNIPWRDGTPFVEIIVPQKIQLDPSGMARKFGIKASSLEGKTDFDIIVDQQKYKERVAQGKLPVIDIAGHGYYVALRESVLRLTSDFSTQIYMPDKFNDRSQEYEFYFRPATKEVVDISPSITELPEGVVKIKLPHDVKLDPVAVARTNNLDIKAFLVKHPFEKELKAVVIPLDKTSVADIVKRNNEPLLKKNIDITQKQKGQSL